MGMLIKFFRFEIWANPVFSGGLVSKTGAIFGLRDTTATGALFHLRLQCNLQKLLRCHRDENLQYGYASTRCDGKIC